MRSATCVLSAILLVACGEDPIAGGDNFPLKVGNWWEFAESGGPSPGTIRKEIVESETYQSQSTLVLLTTQTNSLVDKRSNWIDDGTRIARLRQQRLQMGNVLTYRTYDPGFLRLDRGLTAAGQTMDETHVRKEFNGMDVELQTWTKRYSWVVEADNVSITTPAGTFTCVQIKRTDCSTNCATGSVKTYWYAPGVGKVREQGPLEREELTAYNIQE